MKTVQIFVKDRIPGGDRHLDIEAPPMSMLYIGADGEPRFVPANSGFTAFSLLPAASFAAGNDTFLKSLGTGTEVIARSTKGGVNVKTQATTPADDDNAMLIGTASTSSFVTTAATANPRFRTRVNLSQITEVVFSAGLDQNITSPLPTATAGDGAAFLFDPGDETSHGKTVGNWILTQKVNGTDYFIDSEIPVLLGVDYDLEIRWSGLTPSWYINGVLVGTAAQPNTTATAIGVNIGVQINAASPAGQKDFDVREVQVDKHVPTIG